MTPHATYVCLTVAAVALGLCALAVLWRVLTTAWAAVWFVWVAVWWALWNAWTAVWWRRARD